MEKYTKADYIKALEAMRKLFEEGLPPKMTSMYESLEGANPIKTSTSAWLAGNYRGRVCAFDSAIELLSKDSDMDMWLKLSEQERG